MIVLKRMVGKICKGLKWSEYRCGCSAASCTATIISKRLIRAYELFRITVNVPLTITCGYRCPLHNYKLGDENPANRGAELSRHMTGEAVDIAFTENSELSKKFTLEQIFDIARECGFTYKKHYPDKKIIHLDVRELETY